MAEADKEVTPKEATEESAKAAGEKPTSKDAKEKKPAKPKTAPAQGRSGWTFLALLLALGAGAGSAWLGWQGQMLYQSLQGRIDQQLVQAQDNADALAQLRTELKGRVADQNETLETLRLRLDRLSERMGQDRTSWRLAEAEHLLTIANHRLQLARDRATAIAALEDADAVLAELADPRLTATREALARELNQLQATPAIDRTGISLRLSALTDQIDGLPIIEMRMAPLPEVPGETTVKGAWERLLASLEQLVIIRRDAQTEPLLPPDSAFYLRQNLKLKLEAARLHLIRAEGEAFKRQMETAATWSQSYFDQDQPQVISFQTRLRELAETPIRAELPDISQALRELRKVRRSLARDAKAEGESQP